MSGASQTVTLFGTTTACTACLTPSRRLTDILTTSGMDITQPAEVHLIMDEIISTAPMAPALIQTLSTKIALTPEEILTSVEMLDQARFLE